MSASAALRVPSPDLPDAPSVARVVFGDGFDLAQRYAQRLAGDGVQRGLIGPREAERLWDRHLINSAVLTDLVPPGARVVDVGTGAGLPGIPMSIRRPDLAVDLVEPMQRRVTFLEEVVAELGLGTRVRVVRGRAEDEAVATEVGEADWVVARAVAPLDRLVRWCLPLVAPGGHLLALKGSRAGSEVEEHRAAMRHAGAGRVDVTRIDVPGLDDSTWVVRVERSRGRAKGRA
ncbi:MAG TPA: 16S rRNA (guanine(527)-N(7))-methyltransferase RsmG [Jatrophihabitans sp.]|nr:16S rRNA (guanine(527)-N(7))-methyltransferase RsmG [Jatrophihabitans sp.]